MAPKPKGGKGAKNGLIKMIKAALGPNASPEMIRAATQMARNPATASYLQGPSSAEKYYNSTKNNLKSDADIIAEQTGTYDRLLQTSRDVQQSGSNLASAFSSAMGAASGGLMNLAGGNAAAAQELLNTGQSVAAEAGTIGSSLARTGSAANDMALVQRDAGISNAKIRRDEKYQESKEKARTAKDERLRERALLRDSYQGNVLGILSNLASLRNAGMSGGGYGSGGGVTTPTKTEDEVDPAQDNLWNHGRHLEGLINSPTGTTSTSVTPSGTPVVQGPMAGTGYGASRGPAQSAPYVGGGLGGRPPGWKAPPSPPRYKKPGTPRGAIAK